MTTPSRKKSTTDRSLIKARLALIRSGFRLLGPVWPDLAGGWAARLWCTPPHPSRRRIAAAAAAGPGTPGARFTVRLPGPGAATVTAESWGTGPAVYLQHGWGGWRGQLAGLVEPLVAAGHRVVALDAPGHGDSGPGRLGGRRATLIEVAEALAAVVSVAGPAHAVIAHSGGATATAMAVRDGLTADRLVFLAPMADPMPYVEPFSQALGLTPAIRARLLARMAALIDRPLADLNVPAWAAETTAGLPPLLVVHDTQDREVGYRDGRSLARAWPGATLHTTEGLGHRRLLVDPGVIETVVGFVTARVTAPAAGSSRHT